MSLKNSFVKAGDVMVVEMVLLRLVAHAKKHRSPLTKGEKAILRSSISWDLICEAAQSNDPLGYVLDQCAVPGPWSLAPGGE